MRRYARVIYALLVVVLIITTVMALLDGGYHMIGGLMAAVAAGGFVISLILYSVSMALLDKYEKQGERNGVHRGLGIVIYILCFPVNLWVIYSNLDLLINGGPRWAFG